MKKGTSQKKYPTLKGNLSTIQTKELYPEHHSHAGRVYDPKGIGRTLISSEGGVGKQTGLYEVGDMKDPPSYSFHYPSRGVPNFFQPFVFL